MKTTTEDRHEIARFTRAHVVQPDCHQLQRMFAAMAQFTPKGGLFPNDGGQGIDDGSVGG